MDMKRIGSVPRSKTVILCTGSQGEPMSALHRMAFSEHKQVDIGSGDRVIISASAIPGNETTISRASSTSCSRRARRSSIKPKFFIPVHGEYRMLHKSGDMIVGMGHDRRNIIIGENGRVIELTAKSAKLGATVPSGRVLVDGMGVGDVGTVVLRDRKLLADEGMVVVVMTLSAENAQLISGPDIISRGFVYEKENDKLIDELRRVAMESIAYCEDNGITDWASIKSRVKSGLSGYLFKKRPAAAR